MSTRKLSSCALAAAALVALACAPAAGAATPRLPRLPPNLPRAPKVTTYPALLDAAGYVEVKYEHDDTAKCSPGQDVTIDFASTFELGGPRRTAITVINGMTTSGITANRGGVSHAGELSGYRETNYCPPASQVELSKPTCTSGKGKLQAILGSRVDGAGLGRGDDLASLVHPVTVSLTRTGGASQDHSCRRYLSSGIQSYRPQDSTLSVFDTTIAGIVLPIGANDFDFVGLKQGRWLRRVIALNGPCDRVLDRPASTAAAARDRTKCTVNGRIYIAVKRLRPS